MSFAMDFNGSNAAGRFKDIFQGDDGKHVVFYTRPVLDPIQSTEHGRPFYKDVTYVKMQDPGDNLQVTDRPATDADIKRFPQHYQMFLTNRGEEQPGTPLDVLFPDKPSIIATLRHANVRTVEALANLSAEGQRVVGMGALEWSQKAQTFLKIAGDAKAQTMLNAELDKRDTEIAALKNQIGELTKLVSAMQVAKAAAADDTPATPTRRAKAPVDEI